MVWLETALQESDSLNEQILSQGVSERLRESHTQYHEAAEAKPSKESRRARHAGKTAVKAQKDRASVTLGARRGSLQLWPKRDSRSGELFAS